MVSLTGGALTVTIDKVQVVYSAGAIATSNGGTELVALLLVASGNRGVFYSSCGPFIVQDGVPDGRKRSLTTQVDSVGVGSLVPTTVGGDPHLKGQFGIKFDVFGEPGANYSLLVAPAFEVNMQLAKFGPNCAS
jgi:hypothetical protein